MIKDDPIQICDMGNANDVPMMKQRYCSRSQLRLSCRQHLSHRTHPTCSIASTIFGKNRDLGPALQLEMRLKEARFLESMSKPSA